MFGINGPRACPADEGEGKEEKKEKGKVEGKRGPEDEYSPHNNYYGSPEEIERVNKRFLVLNEKKKKEKKEEKKEGSGRNFWCAFVEYDADMIERELECNKTTKLKSLFPHALVYSHDVYIKGEKKTLGYHIQFYEKGLWEKALSDYGSEKVKDRIRRCAELCGTANGCELSNDDTDVKAVTLFYNRVDSIPFDWCSGQDMAKVGKVFIHTLAVYMMRMIGRS